MGNCLCFGRGNNELEDDLLSRDESNYSVNSFSQDALNNSQGNARSGLRAFVLARHSKHGVLLLEGSKARKGGRFFQLPGGHVDARELLAYGPEEAPRVAAARELYEETGMDFRDRLYRLRPVELEHLGPDGQRLHANGRRYFDGSDVRLATPLSMEDFTLRLSSEHTGFKFEQSVKQAAKDCAKHSGGTSAVAIRLLLSAENPAESSAARTESEKRAL